MEFKMDLELQKLYNTMLLIETKGANTKLMSDCLKFTEQLIDHVRTQEKEEKENG